MKKSLSDKESMLMNWPERVWIYSPVRVFFQKREASKWLRMTGGVNVDKALEIGCGTGRGARILVEKMGFKWVAAFDLEENLIRKSVRLRRPSLRERISFFVGDAQGLPFPDGSFDAVVNYGIIHHILDWQRAISEISRVMKPGGTFFFEEIYPPLYANFLMKRIVRHPTEGRFDGAQFLAELKANGLRLVEGVDTNSKFGIVGAVVKD